MEDTRTAEEIAEEEREVQGGLCLVAGLVMLMCVVVGVVLTTGIFFLLHGIGRF